MADAIILPPLPRPRVDWVDGDQDVSWYTADQIRARDLAVAKAVLEGAKALIKSRQQHETKAMVHHMPTWYAASQYHADRVTAAAQMLDVLDLLEVKHHE